MYEKQRRLAELNIRELARIAIRPLWNGKAAGDVEKGGIAN